MYIAETKERFRNTVRHVTYERKVTNTDFVAYTLNVDSRTYHLLWSGSSGCGSGHLALGT